MKMGINLLLWTAQPTAKEHGPLLEKIKEWGFDGIEYPVAAMTDLDIRELAKRAQELELACTGLLALSATEADPVNPDAALRRAAGEQIRQALDKTRALGGEILVGPLFQGLGRFTGSGPTAEERKRALDVLRGAGEYAARMHMRLALEPLNRFEMFMVNTIAEGARFCEELELPNVGLLADTHHANIEEEKPAAEWAKAMKHIFHVHISENHRGVPGQGHACTAEIFQTLKGAGYDQWLTIEAFGLKVPSLIPPLHLWRPFFHDAEDVPKFGGKYIREQWQQA